MRGGGQDPVAVGFRIIVVVVILEIVLLLVLRRGAWRRPGTWRRGDAVSRQES